MERIKRLTADIDEMGFVPADTKKYNDSLAERVRLLTQQKHIEQDIGKVHKDISDPIRARADAATMLERQRQRREELTYQSRVRQTARQMELQRTLGTTVGGLYGRAEQFGQSRFGRLMGGGAAAAGVMAGGMAKSGMSGTMEQNKLDFEMLQLNRELASAFKPLIELFTEGVTKVRKFMQGLDSTGQNIVLIGSLMAGAWGLRSMGGRMAGGLMGGAMGGMPGMIAGGMIGGVGGGAAAAVSGGGAMNMAALAASGAGAAGLASAGASAAGGASRGGIRGAAGRIARLPIKHPFLVAATAIGVGSAMSSSSPSSGEEYRAARGADADEMDRLQKEGGVAALQKQYDDIRSKRMSGHKAFSYIGGMFGGAGPEHDKLMETERRLMAAGVTPGTGKRRDVTPAQAGYEEIGSAYQRASVAFLNKESDTATDPMKASTVEPILDKIAQILAKIQEQGDPKPVVQ